MVTDCGLRVSSWTFEVFCKLNSAELEICAWSTDDHSKFISYVWHHCLSSSYLLQVYLHGHHYGGPVPAPSHFLCEEPFSNTQNDQPLMQFHVVSLYSISVAREIRTCPSVLFMRKLSCHVSCLPSVSSFLGWTIQVTHTSSSLETSPSLLPYVYGILILGDF